MKTFQWELADHSTLALSVNFSLGNIITDKLIYQLGKKHPLTLSILHYN